MKATYADILTVDDRGFLKTLKANFHRRKEEKRLFHNITAKDDDTMHHFPNKFETALATIMHCDRCNMDIDLLRAKGETVVCWKHAHKACSGRWPLGEVALGDWQQLSTLRYSTHAKYIEEYNASSWRSVERHLFYSMQRNFTMRIACRRPGCGLHSRDHDSKKVRKLADTPCTGTFLEIEQSGIYETIFSNQDCYDELPTALS